MPDIPSIPEPYATIASLTTTVSTMKEAVEIMAGHRGPVLNSTVTWDDLVRLGLIGPEQVPVRAR